MTGGTIPESYMDEVTARRGRRYAFPTLNPKKTALLVVDMQNYFVSPETLPGSLEIIPTINTLCEATRAAGGRVVWIQMEYRDWPEFMGDILGPAYMEEVSVALSRGNEGFEVHSDLKQEPEDWTVIKNRYSAFLPGASDLAPRLAEAGIDTILVTGVVTNACCESTARDAMMMGFRTIMISDGNATVLDELHQATLMTIHYGFGDVRPAEEVVQLLRS